MQFATTIIMIAAFSSVHGMKSHFRVLCELFTIWLPIFTIGTCPRQTYMQLRSKAMSASLHHATDVDRAMIDIHYIVFLMTLSACVRCIHNGPVYMLFIVVVFLVFILAKQFKTCQFHRDFLRLRFTVQRCLFSNKAPIVWHGT